MNKIIHLMFIYCFTDVYCQEAIGDRCKHEDVAGVCKPFIECPYVQNLVLRMKKVTDCLFDDDYGRVTCCVVETGPRSILPPDDHTPSNPPFIETPNYFDLKFKHKKCRFNGTFPITCCSDSDFEDLQVDEPAGCPKPPEPTLQNDRTLSPYERVIMDACSKYSWVGSKCVEVPERPGRYIRNRCRELTDTPKVAGGDPALPREFPHMAILGCFHKHNKQMYVWFGGGSVISEHFILTAAHAVHHQDHGSVQFALLGTINKSDIRSGLLYNVQEILKYPFYNATTKANDIALIKLDTRIVFSEFIHPACLHVPGLNINPERILAGWGYVGRKIETNVLMKAFLYELPAKECVLHLRKKFFKWNESTMLCAGAGGLPRKPDSCEGDSGGPLMAHLKELPCTYAVVGIVSWGPLCGVGMPGSYTNASYSDYLLWIVNNVWERQLVKQLSLGWSSP